MTKQQREFYDRIDDILFNHWNPIQFPVPRDEYKSYVPKVFKIAFKGNEITIAKELYELEIAIVGRGNYNDCLRVAKLIREEQLKIFHL